MSARWARMCALAIATGTLIAVMSASVLYMLVDPSSLLLSVPVLATSLAGALILAQRPDNLVGWILAGGGTLLSLATLGDAYAQYSTERGVLPLDEWAAWYSNWAFPGGDVVVIIGLLLVFPTGHLLSRRWRLAALSAIACFGLLIIGIAVQPGTIDLGPGIGVQNPAGIGFIGPLSDVLGIPLALVSLGTVLLSLVSLVKRTRRARGVERQQIKWLTWTVVVVAVTYMSYLTLELLEPSGYGWLNDTLAHVWILALTVGLPAAIVVAMLRHQLYDIDTLINRSLVYGTLTAVTASSYAVWVVLLQRLLDPLTRGSDLAVAGATLLVAALFRPARHHVQELVDRRFYRRRYDAAKTIEAFSARLRDEMDLDTLATEIRGVVQDTMQPSHVSLWLRVPVRK